MARRTVGMVDAGFLRPQVARALRIAVEPFDVSASDLVGWFNLAASRLGDSVLRVYWYDAAWPPENGKSVDQRRNFWSMEESSNLCVRLGTMQSRPSPWRSRVIETIREMGADVEEFKRRFDWTEAPAQKGVDTLLVLDMVRLAEANAYDTLILIAGDADLAEPIRTVQDAGREVIVAIPHGSTISSDIRRLADEVVEIGDTQLRRLLHSKPGLDYTNELNALLEDVDKGGA